MFSWGARIAQAVQIRWPWSPLEAAAPQPIVALEVADAALAAGAVAGQSPAGAPPARLGMPAMNVRVGANPARVCAVGPGTNPPSTATSRGQRLRRSSSTHGLGKQAALARVAGCAGRRR
jgi:hypothetical protein